MTTSGAIQAERERRSEMWKAVQRIQVDRPLTADEVRQIGCYNGARGIWRDKASTAHLTPAGNGVCVGISSRGKYEDEIGEETGIYDYPSTKVPTYDQGDIDAMRAALSLEMPIFLIRDTNAQGAPVQGKGPRRRVDRVEFVADDPLSRSLIFTFSLGGRSDYRLPEDEQGSCFQERETKERQSTSKKRSQAAFRAAVISRYGERRCCLCDAPPEVIEAAHIVPVSNNGSDWSGNGLLVCRNHHALYDLGRWCLHPQHLEVVPATGHDLSSLQVIRSNVRHLRQSPDREALQWRWSRWA
ncbi:HNH endonuclease [Synechococcus sp. CBW1004]|uniref:HNH endonuclease n=1 Tax=Synechococcus sp. CBW1004 TaxID=1353136 RepID=UPI0018CEE0BA|nr:HNH endonuclease [Synechococcus sp. CBW1004]QPN64476.1 HNH endonuclease [Synechococcus sp. CBW1004]